MIYSEYPKQVSERMVDMRQCMDADNLHRRLHKIIGQLKAIDKMIDEKTTPDMAYKTMTMVFDVLENGIKE